MTRKWSLIIALVWGMVATLSAEDWPMYMHDPARSGVSGEALALPLAELWVYVPPAKPSRAWPDPQADMGELPKLAFDDATHVALAGDAVYFGSSVDNGVHALDAATGSRRWTVFTEGPVRLAPTVADGRVFVGSDDGVVYCLEAKDGRRVWTARPIPGQTRILGAGRLMSLWPVRTDVLVDGGVAYCGAGVFPARETAIVALDAKGGKPIWDTSQFPKKANVSLAPNGYLLASEQQIYVMNGRTVPLIFARADGTLRGHTENAYEIVPGKGLISGDYGVLVGDLFYVGTQNVLHGYKPDGKHVNYWRDTCQLVATSNRYYRLTGPDLFRVVRRMPTRPDSVSAIDRVAYDAAGRKRPIPKEMVQWSYAKSNLQAMVVAGPHVLLGGADEVFALEAATGKELWKGKVDGLAKGLAVANGRLVVSTDKGNIHCFGHSLFAIKEPKAVARSASLPNSGMPARAGADPFPVDAETPRIASLAEAIAKDVKLDRGYGLVIPVSPPFGEVSTRADMGGLVRSGGGASSGGLDSIRLAYELARRTGLLMHVAETNPIIAAKAREMLSAAGAYGTSALGRDLAKGGKVVVDVIPPGGTNGLPYPPYFANLLVVEASLSAVVSADALGQGAMMAKEILRVLKPCGGVLYVKNLEQSTKAMLMKAGTVTEANKGNWTKLIRGRLPGARDWTHQYADAGNTGSSDDDLVRGKPEVLWYGEPGPDKAQERHRRSEAPLSLNGRMFVQGLLALSNTPLLLSFDAYNGVSYWERELPGAERIYITGDCGNLAVSTQGLFVATGKQCQQLDLLTGATRANFVAFSRTNASGAQWAYVAVEGDTLVGSSSSGYQFSDTVFAYDLRTGKLKWHYKGDVIRNATLAIHGGKVFFVEHRGATNVPVVLDPLALSRAAQVKQRAAAAAAEKARAEGGEEHDDEGPGADEPAPAKASSEPYRRTVVALDLATGKPVWAREVDLADCGLWAGAHGGLCLIAKHDMILLCGVYTQYGRERGDEDNRRALALSAKDGATLWNTAIGNRMRPVVVGDRIISVPKAFELRTGERATRSGARGPIPWHMHGGGCGQMSASAGMLFYRHGITLMSDAGTGGTLMAFYGLRPGCLINIIPAGGVIVQVEGSSGCTCYHAIQATVAFVPPGVE